MFLRKNVYVHFDISICICLAHFLRNNCSAVIRIIQKTTNIDYFSDDVKFLRKFSIGAILLASDEFSNYFTVFVDFANFTI